MPAPSSVTFADTGVATIGSTASIAMQGYVATKTQHIGTFTIKPASDAGFKSFVKVKTVSVAGETCTIVVTPRTTADSVTSNFPEFKTTDLFLENCTIDAVNSSSFNIGSTVVLSSTNVKSLINYIILNYYMNSNVAISSSTDIADFSSKYQGFYPTLTDMDTLTTSLFSTLSIATTGGFLNSTKNALKESTKLNFNVVVTYKPLNTSKTDELDPISFTLLFDYTAGAPAIL